MNSTIEDIGLCLWRRFSKRNKAAYELVYAAFFIDFKGNIILSCVHSVHISGAINCSFKDESTLKTDSIAFLKKN